MCRRVVERGDGRGNNVFVEFRLWRVRVLINAPDILARLGPTLCSSETT